MCHYIQRIPLTDYTDQMLLERRKGSKGETYEKYGSDNNAPRDCPDCPDSCPTNVTRMKISNLCCVGEEKIVKNVLNTMCGVKNYSISVLGKYAIIKHCAHNCCDSTADVIRNKLNELHLGAYIQEANNGGENEEEDEGETYEFYKKVAFTGMLASIFVCGLICDTVDLDPSGGIPAALYLSCIFIGAVPIIYNVYIAYIRRAIDINVLMLLAVIGAFSIEQYLDAALVITLFTTASLVEDAVLRWVRGIVNTSSGGIPTKCTIANGQVVAVDSLDVGDVVIYKAGEMISMDGKVIKGEGVVDEGALTGEAKPITKEIGSQAYSGTVMQDGYIEVEVTELPENSTVRKLQQTILEAQAGRGQVMTLVDEFAAYWTPAVILCAMVVFFIAYVCTDDWKKWLSRSLAILVLACPCSIIVSAPIPCVIGIASAAQKGVIIKGSSVVEAAGEIDVVGVDKTGTLTKGNFEVNDVENILSHGGDTSIDPLQVAASIESKSSHPLAAAVVSSFTGCIAESLTDNNLCSVQNVKIVPGVGVSGWVAVDEEESDWVFCVVGNEKVINASIDGSKCAPNPLALEQYEKFVQKHSTRGASILVVSIDDQLRLLVALSDTVRLEAAEMCSIINKKNIAITMLTGDHPTIAYDVALKVGIQSDHVKSRLLPTEKLDWVKKANARDEKVMMIGDGINDAAALTASHIGVAMGAGCTAMASMAAKIVVLSDNLLRVSSVMELCTRIRTVIYTNILVSVSLKAVAMAFAVTGNLSLWEAVLIDVFSLLFVVGLSCTVMSFEWKEPENEDHVIEVIEDAYGYVNLIDHDDPTESTQRERSSIEEDIELNEVV